MHDTYRSRILSENRFSNTLTPELKKALLYQWKHEIRYGLEINGKMFHYKSIHSIVNNWIEGMKGFIIKADKTIIPLTEEQVFAIVWFEDVGCMEYNYEDNDPDIIQMRWEKDVKN